MPNMWVGRKHIFEFYPLYHYVNVHNSLLGGGRNSIYLSFKQQKENVRIERRQCFERIRNINQRTS